MPDVNEVAETFEVPAPTEKEVTGEVAPVETEEGQDNGEVKAEETEETPEQVEAKHKSRNQRRLERAKTRATVAETEARMLREELATLRSKPAVTTEDKEPAREDYEDYESFVKATAKYEGRQEARAILKAEREANQGKEKQSQAADDYAKVAKAWTDREAAFSKETKDYEEVTTAYVEDGIEALSPAARRLIVESDAGPAVLYHLGNDSDLAERIAGLSPIKQVAELGRLEAKFSAPAKKPSNAPPPATPARASKTVTKDVTKMSIDELNKFAGSQGSVWGRK